MHDANVSMLPIDKIDTTLRLKRGGHDEITVARLTGSIKRCGVLNPVLVMKRPAGDGTHDLISGLHRLSGARRAGQDEIPARILAESDEITLELLLDAVDEDTARKTIQPLELAELIEAMKAKGMPNGEIMSYLHMTKGHLNNLVRLLELPEEVKGMIQRGDLPLAKARTLAALKDLEKDERIISLAEETIDRGETCAKFNERVQDIKTRFTETPAVHRKEQELNVLHRIKHQGDRLLDTARPLVNGKYSVEEVAEILRPLHRQIGIILEKAQNNEPGVQADQNGDET